MLESFPPQRPDYDALRNRLYEELNSLGIRDELTFSASSLLTVSPSVFSAEARVWLLTHGFEIFHLPGNSLSYWEQMMNAPAKVDIAHEIPEAIRAESYTPTEAAINTNRLFVTNSICKNYSAQELLTATMARSLPDFIRLLPGTAAQLVDLAMLNLTLPQRRVLGGEIGFRSSSPVDTYSAAHCSVSFQGGDHRLFVKGTKDSNANPVLGRCALIVPQSVAVSSEILQ